MLTITFYICSSWRVGRCMVEIHIIITFITLVITYIICMYMGRGVWHKSNYCGDRSNYPKNYFFARITSPIEPPWWRTYHLVPIDTPPSPLSMLYPAPPLPHPSSLPDPRPPPAQWRHLGGGAGGGICCRTLVNPAGVHLGIYLNYVRKVLKHWYILIPGVMVAI